jgi:hypothetical protein
VRPDGLSTHPKRRPHAYTLGLKRLEMNSTDSQRTTPPWRMIEVKNEKTGVILSRTGYTDTDKSRRQCLSTMTTPSPSIPGSELSVCQPGGVIAFHNHNIIVRNICKTRVKRSLLISKTGLRKRISKRQISDPFEREYT